MLNAKKLKKLRNLAKRWERARKWKSLQCFLKLKRNDKVCQILMMCEKAENVLESVPKRWGKYETVLKSKKVNKHEESVQKLSVLESGLSWKNVPKTERIWESTLKAEKYENLGQKFKNVQKLWKHQFLQMGKQAKILESVANLEKVCQKLKIMPTAKRVCQIMRKYAKCWQHLPNIENVKFFQLSCFF